MATKFYELDPEQRITVTADMGGKESFDFPDDFDFSNQSDYKIIDGALMFCPLPAQEAGPSTEKRLTDVEAALKLLLSETIGAGDMANAIKAGVNSI